MHHFISSKVLFIIMLAATNNLKNMVVAFTSNFPLLAIEAAAAAITRNSRMSRTAAIHSKSFATNKQMTRVMSSDSNISISSHINRGPPSENEKQIVHDMLYRIRECNNVPPDIKKKLMYFVVDGIRVGKVTQNVAQLLCSSSPTGEVFQIVASNMDGGNESVLTLSEEVGTTLEQRTDAVMTVMENLRESGVITGWRDELYPAAKGFYDEPVLLVERAAAPFLGMQQYGVHINGMIKGEDGEEKMWMARRSKTKSKYPGMLDHIVAGGQPAGLSLLENVVKECAEEAGVPEDLTLAGIQAVGAVSYEIFELSDNDVYDGVVSRALLFNYDLTLPNHFTPKVVDGEVEEFFLWSVDDIFASMNKDYVDPIKPNCYLVIIDFLLRKGYISPEVPGYLDILRELRGGYCG